MANALTGALLLQQTLDLASAEVLDIRTLDLANMISRRLAPRVDVELEATTFNLIADERHVPQNAVRGAGNDPGTRETKYKVGPTYVTQQRVLSENIPLAQIGQLQTKFQRDKVRDAAGGLVRDLAREELKRCAEFFTFTDLDTGTYTGAWATAGLTDAAVQAQDVDTASGAYFGTRYDTPATAEPINDIAAMRRALTSPGLAPPNTLVMSRKMSQAIRECAEYKTEYGDRDVFAEGDIVGQLRGMQTILLDDGAVFLDGTRRYFWHNAITLLTMQPWNSRTYLGHAVQPVFTPPPTVTDLFPNAVSVSLEDGGVPLGVIVRAYPGPIGREVLVVEVDFGYTTFLTPQEDGLSSTLGVLYNCLATP